VLLVPLNRRRKAEQLMHSAGVDGTWSGPPSAEAIRQRDQERMLEDPLLAAEPTPEDAAFLAALLQGRSPEQLAGALIRLYRQRLPEPEELFDGGAQEPRFGDDRRTAKGVFGRGGERSGRRGPGGGAPRARSHPCGRGGRGLVPRERRPREERRPQMADPADLPPGPCDQADIGAIRIFERETKFEIMPQTAARFAEAVNGAAEGGLRIQPAAGPPEAAERGAFKPRPGPKGAKPARSGPPKKARAKKANAAGGGGGYGRRD
jgi:ATP-dependent RNA helicase DeaD